MVVPWWWQFRYWKQCSWISRNERFGDGKPETDTHDHYQPTHFWRRNSHLLLDQLQTVPNRRILCSWACWIISFTKRPNLATVSIFDERGLLQVALKVRRRWAREVGVDVLGRIMCLRHWYHPSRLSGGEKDRDSFSIIGRCGVTWAWNPEFSCKFP